MTVGKGSFLGEFEQVVLLAVAQLESEGYGVSIRQEIEERGGRDVSVGAVYATLSRLEDKGFLSSWEGAPEAKRGGRARRYYRLEPAGARELQAARGLMDRMWEDLDLGSEPA